jgi:hypothetical protein
MGRVKNGGSIQRERFLVILTLAGKSTAALAPADLLPSKTWNSLNPLTVKMMYV